MSDAEIAASAEMLLLDVIGPEGREMHQDLFATYHRWIWRELNLGQVGTHYRSEIEKRGLDPEKLDPLPQGDAFRVMEAASLEDDVSVQKLWAGLIVSARDPLNSTKASKVFIDLLQSIGPAEAGLLELLHLIELPRRPVERTGQSINDDRKKALEEINAFASQRWRCFDQETRENAVQNLMRLRCVGFGTGKQLNADQLMRSAPFGVDRQRVPASAHALAEMADYLENLALAASGTGTVPARRTRSTNQLPEAQYQLTSLGRALMRACLGKS